MGQAIKTWGKAILGRFALGLTYVEVLGIYTALRVGLIKLAGGSAVRKIRRAGIPHPLFLRVPSSDVPTCKKIFIDQEYRLDMNGDLSVIVDAGANIGLASIYWAAQFPRAKIIALEPEESNFQMLKKNAAPYGNIIPVCGALWNKNEDVEIVDSGSGKWGFLTQKKSGEAEKPSGRLPFVQGMTVGRIMDEYELSHIDLLKIDIEGSEQEVFSDAAAWINKVGAIVVELHERLRVGCSRSFYNGTNGFDNEWVQGENVVLTRNNGVRK